MRTRRMRTPDSTSTRLMVSVCRLPAFVVICICVDFAKDMTKIQTPMVPGNFAVQVLRPPHKRGEVPLVAWAPKGEGVKLVGMLDSNAAAADPNSKTFYAFAVGTPHQPMFGGEGTGLSVSPSPKDKLPALQLKQVHTSGLQSSGPSGEETMAAPHTHSMGPFTHIFLLAVFALVDSSLCLLTFAGPRERLHCACGTQQQVGSIKRL